MSTQVVARAIRDHARKQAESRRSVVRAQVVNRAPLRCELMDGELTLDIDDDFDLSAWLRFYHREFGINVGDTMLLHVEQGTYIAFDVQSDDPLRKKLVKS